LLAIKWQLLDDFRKLISGRISNQPFPDPKGRELVIFIAGKAIFFTMAFGIPLLFHSIGVVLLYYGVAGLVAGMALSVVFQVAHCVEEAEFPLPGRILGASSTRGPSIRRRPPWTSPGGAELSLGSSAA